MYRPQHRPKLEVVHLIDEHLALVTSAWSRVGHNAGYIRVDWGPEFTTQHNASYADIAGPALAVNAG